MMTQYNNPFLRQNGLQQGQVGAATTGQYSRPAGTVTPPVTQQGGGAGFQQMQAPGMATQQGGGLTLPFRQVFGQPLGADGLPLGGFGGVGVLFAGGIHRRLPVRTNRPIPKELLGAAMEQAAAVRLQAPVAAGQVIVANLLGTGADLIASRSMDRVE